MNERVLKNTASNLTCIAFGLLTSLAVSAAPEGSCDYYVPGNKSVYWGDLHVHTGYSLDAYAFGNRNDPGDAFAFGRGQEITLADGKTNIKLRKPLDFMAVTDHAESFDVMYLCSDPLYSDLSYCQGLREGSVKGHSMETFRNFLLPLIAGETPKASPLCAEEGIDCRSAASRQWQRTQQFANNANAPCEFTAFIGNEWSATPNDQHWHRNLIFSSDAVTAEAIDYIRYPSVEGLWEALDNQCKPEEGCDVIAIPHNVNLAEGGGFDVETSDDLQLQRRAKYERLVEIHQSKGNSECLPAYWDDDSSDCGFERLIPHNLDLHKDENLRAEKWQRLRSGYARSLLQRGLLVYSHSNKSKINPLKLGFIGSTDGHTGAAGAVDEINWKGDAWGWGDDVERRQGRLDYNPGGLVAVWAEENTRASIFSALKRRETYGTSGPRITLKFLADRDGDKNSCSAGFKSDHEAVMGGTLEAGKTGLPRFTVQASMDEVPLSRIDIIKGVVREGKIVESVTTIIEKKQGQSEICVSWVDADFDKRAPAFWYARVLEQPTPRWSKLDCELLDNCQKLPAADKMIKERAWSSPIWHLP